MARVWVSSLETQMVVLSWKTSFTNKVFNFKWAELDALIKGFRLAQLLNVDKDDVKWVNRGCNKLVDSLCNWSLSKCCNLSFDLDYLRDIHNI
ncbi:hypothetical protein Golax_021771, partial [Gossypium laxum]|nr:hypothetical protein [Gossypium laxum]